MSLLDFLKKKELAEIASLKQDLSKASSRIAELQELNNKLTPLQKYSTIHDLEVEELRLRTGNDELIRYRDIILGNYDKTLIEKRQELDILDDEILLQTFGIYTPLYDFQKLDDYKEKLDEIRDQEKDLIRYKEAGITTIEWRVDGSVAKGRSQTNQRLNHSGLKVQRF